MIEFDSEEAWVDPRAETPFNVCPLEYLCDYSGCNNRCYDDYEDCRHYGRILEGLYRYGRIMPNDMRGRKL